LFDTRFRYTALSSLYQLSGVDASGLTPLIAAWLVSVGGGTLWPDPSGPGIALAAAYAEAVFAAQRTIEERRAGALAHNGWPAQCGVRRRIAVNPAAVRGRRHRRRRRGADLMATVTIADLAGGRLPHAVTARRTTRTPGCRTDPGGRVRPPMGDVRHVDA